MAKHTDWVRARNDDPARTRIVQFEGRKLMGALMQRLRLTGNAQGKMRRTLADGTQITASFDGTTPIVSVVNPPASATSPDTRDKAGVWIPRGFVIYPISDSAEQGWGVPVIQDESAGPYDAINLAPGLDVTRWTAGGQLGQVLLTTVEGAGYPSNKPADLISPMLFHPTAGIHPNQPLVDGVTTWSAYRLEFDDYSSQRPGIGSSLLARTFKREMFDLVNELRLAAGGRTVLMLPIRGFYDSAQATTEVMAAAQIVGHFSEEFAPTYETTEDRGGKDGILATSLLPGATPAEYDDRNYVISIGENLTGNPGGPTEVLGVDPYGLDITRMPPGSTMTAQQCFDQFLTSAGHTANMKDVIYNFGAVGGASATSLGVGFHTAFYGQHFVRRTTWIAAGNMAWHPADPEIPIVSWDGFNALNLAWETWPIRMLANLGAFTVNLYLGRYFTSPPAVASPPLAEQVGTSYSDLPVSGLNRRNRPGMSPRIYMRGRCIALAPHGGLVWAASVQRIADVDQTPVYRLVALVHHPADQPEQFPIPSDYSEGVTRALRVWYIDLPDSLGFPGNPATPIRGVYGEEDLPDDWPWITTNSPYSWRGGALVNVTDGNTLLKYASQWRFNPAGTKAVCLRDYGEVDDYKTEYLRSQSDPPGHGPLGATIYADYPMSGQLGVFTGARWVKYLELDVSDATAPILSVSAVNAGAAPQKLATTYAAASTGTVNPAAWIRPAAVDYDEAGALIFAHHVICYYPGPYLAPGVFAQLINQARHGIYFSSNWDVTYPTAGPSAVWYSSVVGLPDADLMGALASVIDVRDKVWAHLGAPCSANDSGPVGSDHLDYPLYVAETSPDSGYRTLTFTAECLACTQIPAEHTARMYRNGVQILECTVANDDDLVHDFRLFPNTDPRFMPWSLNPALQATYAKDENGAWVATLAYIPQAAEAFQFNPDGSPGAETGTVASADSQCFNYCGEGWQDSTRPTIGFAETVNGGGAMTSSFADSTALAELTQTPGSNARSPYVRIV